MVSCVRELKYPACQKTLLRVHCTNVDISTPTFLFSVAHRTSVPAEVLLFFFLGRNETGSQSVNCQSERELSVKVYGKNVDMKRGF